VTEAAADGVVAAGIGVGDGGRLRGGGVPVGEQTGGVLVNILFLCVAFNCVRGLFS
jgi:hypothetical protein